MQVYQKAEFASRKFDQVVLMEEQDTVIHCLKDIPVKKFSNEYKDMTTLQIVEKQKDHTAE